MRPQGVRSLLQRGKLTSLRIEDCQQGHLELTLSPLVKAVDFRRTLRSCQMFQKVETLEIVDVQQASEAPAGPGFAVCRSDKAVPRRTADIRPVVVVAIDVFDVQAGFLKVDP